MTLPPRPPRSCLLSWSSGKDSAWALHELRASGWTVDGLFTTCNGEAQRVAMHGVRTTLLEAQARTLGLPLRVVDLPSPCTNAIYEARTGDALRELRASGARTLAFGDLFLRDVRDYRERQAEAVGLVPHFPLWGEDTHALARRMLAADQRAVLTCIDPQRLDPSFAGRAWDESLLAELPAGVDPCGERGEFHTFVHDGPQFRAPLTIARGETVERGGFVFTDFDLVP